MKAAPLFVLTFLPFAFLLLPSNRDGQVARRLVAVEVCGGDAEGVVAGRQRGCVPDAARGPAVAYGVRQLVEEACLLTAVDGDAALVRVGDLGRVGVGGQSVGLYVHTRALEALRGRAVRQQQLVAEPVEPEAASRLVAVHLVVRVHDYANLPAQQQTPAAPLLELRARLVEEPY